MESDIGNLIECMEVFRESVHINVVGRISPYFKYDVPVLFHSL